MNFDLNAKTDEDFFGALERRNTNLGHLFEGEIEPDEQPDTLRYKPDKWTTKSTISGSSTNISSKSIGITATSSSSPQPAGQAWQTVLAKVAQAYKENTPVGRVGVALLQNVESQCRIIVYKAKVNVLTTCSLRAELPQVHRRDNYLQFYDDNLCCWSIYFDAEENTEEFISKLIELNIVVNRKTEEANEGTELVTEDKSEMSTNGKFKEKPPIASSKPTKTSLITRMAKVGQSLPKLPPLPSQLQSSLDGTTTDSSDTETISTPGVQLKHSNNSATTRSISRALVKTEPLPVTQTTTVVAAVNPLESQFMQMMLTENRTYNSELRMNVNKLESKVEKVLDKLELLHTTSTRNKYVNKEDELLELEEKLLELKKENRNLRQKIEEKPPTHSYEQIMKIYSAELAEVNLANCKSLERLVGDLLQQRNALHVQLEQWKKDLALKNLELKSQQTRIEEDQVRLAKTIAKNELVEAEIKSYQKRLIDKEQLECDLRHQLAEANKECLAQRQLFEASKESEVQANEMIEKLEAAKNMLQQQLDESKSKSKFESKYNNELPVEKQIEAVLKKTMNNLYANLATKLENIVPMQKDAIIAIVGKTIREETLKSMSEL